jgi:hypothetical protein
MQTAYQFDKVSLQKIGKGALIALAGTLATYLAANVDAIQAVFSQNPILASLVGAVISIGVYIVNQFVKGENK